MARLLVAEKYDCNYYLNLDTIEILTGRLVQIIVFFKNNSYFPFEKDIESIFGMIIEADKKISFYESFREDVFDHLCTCVWKRDVACNGH